MAEARYQLTDYKNNERVSFLFSDFPKEKSLNPKHWESKYSFWSTEIDRSCRFNRDVCVSCKKLQNVFQHPETKRIPKGMFVNI